MDPRRSLHSTVLQHLRCGQQAHGLRKIAAGLKLQRIREAINKISIVARCIVPSLQFIQCLDSPSSSSKRRFLAPLP